MAPLIGFDLLDRQIVDRDGTPVGTVDDVELDDELRVVALLTGARALGPRLGGTLGRWVAALAQRLSENRDGPRRIDWALVDHVGSAVHLSCRNELLPAPELEKWLGEHVIDRIPGASDEGE